MGAPIGRPLARGAGDDSDLMMNSIIVLSACFLACISISATRADVPATVVFKAGEDGYKIFRIPAIVRAANNDLLAFCEAREGGDASEIDLVLKRSSDDGKTWGKIEVVQESDDFISLYADKDRKMSIGNPAPVVDQMDFDHPCVCHLQ